MIIIKYVRHQIPTPDHHITSKLAFFYFFLPRCTHGPYNKTLLSEMCFTTPDAIIFCLL